MGDVSKQSYEQTMTFAVTDNLQAEAVCVQEGHLLTHAEVTLDGMRAGLSASEVTAVPAEQKPHYTVSVAISPADNKMSSSKNYQITVTLVPNAGYEFVNTELTVNGTAATMVGRTESCRPVQFTVTLKAEAVVYPITVNGGKATLYGKEVTSAAYGNSIDLVADSAPSGMAFVYWRYKMGDKSYVSSQQKKSLLVSNEVIAEAVFVEKDKALQSAELQAAGLESGMNLDTAAVLPLEADAHYSAVFVDKYIQVGGSFYQINSQPFQSGRTYRITVELIPDVGYEFGDITGDSATLNGEGASSVAPDERFGLDKRNVRVTFVVTIVDPPAVLLGDVDENGTVNMVDVSKTYGYVIGKLTETELNTKLADMNGDGKVRLQDVYAIYRAASK